MNPRSNPFAPGAGTPPPELAGREEILEKVSIALDRTKTGRSSQGVILYGLRGVGKTVLLNRMKMEAESQGFITIQLEAVEGRSLPSMLIPSLRSSLLRLNRFEALKEKTLNAMKTLASFAAAAQVNYGDLEISFDSEQIPGLADSGELEIDLEDLFVDLADVAREKETAIVLFIDELQYFSKAELTALIGAIHQITQQQQPIIIIGAGLPQLVGTMGNAKSYAERLFDFTPVEALDFSAAVDALQKPVKEEDVSFEENAVEEIINQTEGYPYFLQEWGKHAWEVAEESPITIDDVLLANESALADLDNSFFRVRFDRLTPKEKQYMRAMAELGPGIHKSGDIAGLLDKSVSSVAPLRNSLIKKGMVYSPAHGDTAFTVPLFDQYMMRVMDTFH